MQIKKLLVKKKVVYKFKHTVATAESKGARPDTLPTNTTIITTLTSTGGGFLPS